MHAQPTNRKKPRKNTKKLTMLTQEVGLCLFVAFDYGAVRNVAGPMVETVL